MTEITHSGIVGFPACGAMPGSAGACGDAPANPQHWLAALIADEAAELVDHGVRSASRGALRRHCEVRLGRAVTSADIDEALRLSKPTVQEVFL